jgi:hypothetical protein
MSKLDFKKDLKRLYNPPTKKFTIVDVPQMNFLMVDGHGNPNNNPDYQAVVETLYAMAYSIKFAIKSSGVEYVVPPLEGLWWAEDLSSFTLQKKDQWDWTMLIMQPEMVTADLVEQVRHEVAPKKQLSALSRLRFDAYHEGLSAQIMYLGAYADEGPTIAQMHAFIQDCDYVPNGKHHEIYLGDPRKTAPEKLKTVIRQPIRAKG